MKVRFDGLDVAAMVSHLQRVLLGRRVINIYDGSTGSSSDAGGGGGGDTYVFKLDGSSSSSSSSDKNEAASSSKTFLLLQSGIRFHDASHFAAEQNSMPSPYCAKLRKHLRGLRLETIQQVGHDMERVVLFSFIGGGGGSNKCSLILELYSKGNLILTNHEYQILALLRSHVYENNNNHPSNNNSQQDDDNDDAPANKDNKVLVQVGRIYPVSYAANVSSTNDPSETDAVGFLSEESYHDWIQKQLQQQQQQQQQPSNGSSSTSKKKKKTKALTLKTMLLRGSSGVTKYGPAVIEHCILTAALQPHTPLQPQEASSAPENGAAATNGSAMGGISTEQWQQLRETFLKEAPAVLQRLQQSAAADTPGYLLYKPRGGDQRDSDDNDDKDNKATTAADNNMPHPDKVLQDFQPHLLRQHDSYQPHVLTCRDFGHAVETYFAQLDWQKAALKQQAAQQAAHSKLERVRLDQAQRLSDLRRAQEAARLQAAAVQEHAVVVDQALQVINSALDSGMDWAQLQQLVEVEQGNANPVAMLIAELKLETDAMVLRLPMPEDTTTMHGPETDGKGETGESEELEKETTILVEVSLKDSAHANARNLFAKYRASKEKSIKTIEASTKALQAAEETAQRQLAQAQKQRPLPNSVGAKRALWFEKFHWFITSDNYLVLAGKDAHQNELLVKRYLRPGDAYLHADVHGAASCILRAKRRRIKKCGKTEPLPLSEQALREAGSFTICRSSAWSSRMVTSAWWVEAHQVSKTAPTGEYLTVGSFMVRGKKNFLPPSPLELGLACLFRISDDDPESMLRHKNERRDFTLMEEDDFDDDDMGNNSDPGKNGTGRDTEKDSASNEERVDNESAGRPKNGNESKHSSTEDSQQGNNAASGVREDDNQDIVNDAATMTEEAELTLSAKADDSEPPPSTNAGDTKDQPSNRNASPASKKTDNKRRGLSVRERKLIKKYGSLEEANRVLAANDNSNQQQKRNDPDTNQQETSSVAASSSNGTGGNSPSTMKRGKKAKMKKMKKKYRDQDGDDRDLALLLLQGGEGKKKNGRGRSSGTGAAIGSEAQQLAAAETAAVLMKDSSKVVQQLSEGVRSTLAECVTVWRNMNNDNDDDVSDVRWEKLDASILEQLIALEPEEAQLAAAKRLLSLKQTTRVDNFSASLAGILRTIRKYGYENLNKDSQGENEDKSRKTDAQKEQENLKWKQTLAEEGILESTMDANEDAVDDSLELYKLTGKPVAEDLLLHVLPVCAPYQTVSQYKFRVKLTPGSMKRGKAAKQCVEMFLKAGVGGAAGDKGAERFKELVKHVSDNEWVNTICSDVKITAPGASKLNKQQKSKSKRNKQK